MKSLALTAIAALIVGFTIFTAATAGDRNIVADKPTPAADTCCKGAHDGKDDCSCGSGAKTSGGCCSSK